MAQENKRDLLRRHVEDAAAAEHSMEEQLRAFASDCDDDDVRVLFTACAEDARARGERLTNGIGPISPLKAAAASTLAAAPRLAQMGHIQEERTVQNLIAAYALEAGASAMLQALATTAEAAREAEVAGVARDGLKQSSERAERLLHLLPTRSIIAYNMLTTSEVDPSVETKYREASWST